MNYVQGFLNEQQKLNILGLSDFVIYVNVFFSLTFKNVKEEAEHLETVCKSMLYVCFLCVFFFNLFKTGERETYSWILCVVLRVWTKTEGQADAVSYESACSLLNCSTNEEIKKW